jgi:hypothetical protein
MASTNRVTSILPEPNKEGDNVIGITLGDGSTFDVTIDLGAAQVLVEILQRLTRHEARALMFPRFPVRSRETLHLPGRQIRQRRALRARAPKRGA